MCMRCHQLLPAPPCTPSLTLQGWDLRTYYEGLRSSVMGSWVATGLFAGVVLPALVAAGGLGGLVSWWLMPWLVFHAWLSTITLCQHTAPNIPWRRDGPTGGYDRTRSVISGTVTLRMPGWLEALLNYPNYHVPMHLSLDGIPFYHAKKATEAMREKLWPYMSEAHFGPKLITNHVTKWQVRGIPWEGWPADGAGLQMGQVCCYVCHRRLGVVCHIGGILGGGMTRRRAC